MIPFNKPYLTGKEIKYMTDCIKENVLSGDGKYSKKCAELMQEKFKAKNILLTENGKLWGENIWSDNILVLGFDNTIYTLKPLSNSKTTDSIVFYKKIPKNTLGFSNAAQKYDGKEYAVVLTNYLDDNSATIIHELFHILQHFLIYL